MGLAGSCFTFHVLELEVVSRECSLIRLAAANRQRGLKTLNSFFFLLLKPCPAVPSFAFEAFARVWVHLGEYNLHLLLGQVMSMGFFLTLVIPISGPRPFRH